MQDPVVAPRPDRLDVGGPPSYTVIIPTDGRSSLTDLLRTLDHSTGPRPDQVLIIDDRSPVDSEPELQLPVTSLPIEILRGSGAGPATARNLGWSAAHSDWVVFLGDDMIVSDNWAEHLVQDLGRCGELDAGCSGVVGAPPPTDRRPTDAERDLIGLITASWSTADMAYRRSRLFEVGGFDKTFSQDYLGDADLALRLIDAGYTLQSGRRISRRPTSGDLGWWAGVQRQRATAEQALMLAWHGRHWRRRADAGHSRMPVHALTTAAAATAVVATLTRRPRLAVLATAAWTALTTEFAVRRIIPGPRTAKEIGTVVITSIAIPPVASVHRLRGEWRARFGRASAPAHRRAANSPSPSAAPHRNQRS